MKAPIKWMGGKSKLAPKILELMPQQYNAYYEPFLGSGAVLFALEPMNSIASDLMIEPISVFNAIKKNPALTYELFQALADELWEKGSDYYYEIRELYNQTKMNMDVFHVAAHFMFLLKAGFNGVVRFNPNKNNSWNVPYGKRGYKGNKPVKLYNEKLLSELEQYSAFLNTGNKEFLTASYEDIIPKAQKNDVIYCDPPYTETSSDKRYNMGWSWDEDVKLSLLLREAAKRGANFILSNIIEYKGNINNQLIELYEDFSFEVVEHKYIVGPKSKTKQAVKEVLIYS